MMRRAIWTLFLLVWGLWFGGILFLFFAVTALFGQSHGLGASAAPVIFRIFEEYRLTLALVAIALCAFLPIRQFKLKGWIFVLIAVGCVTALASSLILTPRINALHVAGAVNTPKFWHLHAISSTVYLIEAIDLLIVGLILPAVMVTEKHF